VEIEEKNNVFICCIYVSCW